VSGTQVNGKRTYKSILRNGDVIHFGDVEVHVELEDDKVDFPGGYIPETMKEELQRVVKDNPKLYGSSSSSSSSSNTSNQGEKGFARGKFVTLSAKRLTQDLDNLVKKIVDNWKFYFCESCFHLRGELVEMKAELESESHVSSGYYECPVCQCAWRLNRGVARHVVAEKIKHYQTLAEKLGIDIDGVPVEKMP